jgi:Glyoxalase-like domain
MALQLAIDCTEPRLLVPFWCEALGYVPEPPPGGHSSWNDYWREMGVPDDELPTDHDAADSIVDPAGVGPRVFFQVVPEAKSVKNRVHLDLKISGGRAVPLPERRERIEAEAKRLEALGATRVRVNSTEGLDHYGVVMQDPEGNEFCVA